MTGRLRAATYDLARAGAAAALSEERLLACERVAAALANRRFAPAARDPDRALRRLVHDGWVGGASDAQLAKAVADALARRRRSLDRALIHAWLLHWPHDRPAGAVLQAAVGAVAERHDWPWRDRGQRWRLWEGPNMLRAALATAGPAERGALLHETGLAGPLSTSRFAMAVKGGGLSTVRLRLNEDFKHPSIYHFDDQEGEG